jgi:hypothetical protein
MNFSHLNLKIYGCVMKGQKTQFHNQKISFKLSTTHMIEILAKHKNIQFMYLYGDLKCLEDL